MSTPAPAYSRRCLSRLQDCEIQGTLLNSCLQHGMMARAKLTTQVTVTLHWHRHTVTVNHDSDGHTQAPNVDERCTSNLNLLTDSSDPS